jgi:hypothetical protein
MPTLEERLSEAENINARIGTLLGNSYTGGPRRMLPLAYANLSLDHHLAFVLLMRHGMHGSAMALVRVIFEAMICAHWVAKCATDEEARQAAEKDDFRFPKMKDMTAAVDRASDPSEETLNFFQVSMTESWEVMNSFTHSGRRQLARQFSGDSIEARYPEEELISGINSSTASVLLLGYLIATITGQENAATEIELMFSFGEP